MEREVGAGGGMISLGWGSWKVRLKVSLTSDHHSVTRGESLLDVPDAKSLSHGRIGAEQRPGL